MSLFTGQVSLGKENEAFIPLKPVHPSEKQSQKPTIYPGSSIRINDKLQVTDKSFKYQSILYGFRIMFNEKTIALAISQKVFIKN
jgi:hypothetical protein